MSDLRKRLPAFVFLPVLAVLSAAAIAVGYRNLFHDIHDKSLMLMATPSLVILVGMSGLYIFAYKVYRDLFFALLAAGWLANGAYIFIEGFYSTEASFSLSVSVYLLAQIHSVIFYIASFITPAQTLEYKQIFRGLGFWLSAISLNLYLIRWIPRPKLPDHYLFIIATASGVFFSTWALFRIGRALRLRLKPEVHGSLEKIFPGTFFFYGLIQPLYFFKLVPNMAGPLILGFALGLAAKIANSICAIVTVQRDFARIHEQQERVSMWEDLGILAASLEHEIKNPLQVIANYLDSFGEKYQSNDDIKSRLRKLEQERQRIFAATEIVNNLRGGREYYAQLMIKTSIGDLVRRSVKAVKEEMQADQVLFKVEGDEPLFTTAYPPVLQQVFVNLLKNAVEAIRQARRDSGLVKIKLQSPARQGKILTVAVTDNGCGIPESNMAKIGHLFSTKRGQKPNSGIGLFISRRILGFHNGSLEMQSKEGAGTTASVLLPVWAPE